MDLEQRISQIEDRNHKVELDKAWETSTTRKGVHTLLTYIVLLIVFLVMGRSQPFLYALLSTVGTVLSVFVVSQLRNYWESNIYKK